MLVRRPLLATVAAATVAGLLTVPATAQEADRPSSSQVERQLGPAEARLAQLEADASLAVEEVNEARVALAAIEAELAATTEAATTARERAAQLRVATDAVARTLYKSGGANLQFGALLDADGPTEAGARYATVQRVLASHRGDVEALRAATTELSTLEDRLRGQRDEATVRSAEVAERQERLERTLAEQADEVAALERELADARGREETARRAAEEAERAEAARRETAPAAPSAAASPDRGTSGSSSSTGTAPTPPSTRQSAQVAVDTALAQVGKPYQWGGSGPGSFDCSGLTSYGWRAAGVSLPHSSRAQYGATRRVSRGDLAPGDLVFFGSPIHHVAMYIGGGNVVEAARSGIPVRVSSSALGRSDIAGYGRP